MMWAIPVVGWILASGGIRPPAVEALRRGVAAYSDLDYAAARGALLEAERESDVLFPVERAQLFQYLGFCEVIAGDRDAAKRHFLEAIEIDPRLRLDPVQFSPKLIEVFEAARAERIPSRSRIGPEQASPLNDAVPPALAVAVPAGSVASEFPDRASEAPKSVDLAPREPATGGLAPPASALPVSASRSEPRRLSLGAGFGPMFRARVLDVSGGGASYSARFIGGGPAMTLLAGRGPLSTWVSASSLQYGATRASQPDGSHTAVSGGRTERVDAGIEAVTRLGDAWLGVKAGVEREMHRGSDVRDDIGSLGILPSYSRESGRIGVVARSDPRSAAFVEAGVVVDVFGNIDVEPAVHGTDPRLEPGLSATLRGGLRRGGWTFEIAGTAERRVTRFHGTSDAPLDPPLRDARWQEEALSGQFTIRWAP